METSRVVGVMTFEEELTNFSSLPAVRLITYTEQDVQLTGLPRITDLRKQRGVAYRVPDDPVKQPV